MSSIAVLITCHNRKEKTLKCLKELYNQQGTDSIFEIEIFLVDDASTDGTSEEIKKFFPEVNIIQGSGNLYWNRGMHLAWETAAAQKEFDYFLWLNDDTYLNEDVVNSLFYEISDNVIVCGTTIDSQNGIYTYGGHLKKNGVLVIPNGSFQECDYFNGNCVLISKSVFQLVGYLDTIFHHAVGDFDYGLRAKKLGVKLLVAPTIVGICDGHKNLPKWRDASINVVKRLQALYSPASGCYPPQFFVFDKRHQGNITAIFHFITIHLRAIFPSLWKIKEKIEN